MKSHGLGYDDRLHGGAAFRSALKAGVRRHQAPFNLHVGRSEDTARLGIVASRHMGTAVRRNLAKRLIREVFRHHKPMLPSGHYVVRLAKPLLPFSRQAQRDALEMLFNRWSEKR